MPQLIPVDHDPFDMGGALANAGSGDWQRGVNAASTPFAPAPSTDRASALMRAMGSAGNTIQDNVAAPAWDAIRSVPGGLARGLAHHVDAYRSPVDDLTGARDVGPQEPSREALGSLQDRLHHPETRLGHYADSIAEVAGNPMNWIGPGSMAVKGAWNAASGTASEAGGQLYEGTPQEGLARSLGSFGPMAAERLAGVLPKVIPQGAAGVFGGRMAVTADHQALNRAEKMANAGHPADQIWRDTGWMQGPDGKWRFEISDHAATMNQGLGSKLGDVLQHPELFEAYPSLANIKASPLSKAAEGRGASAAYRPSNIFNSGEIQYPRGGDDQLPHTLHEVQHAIQQREGFASGTSRAAELPFGFGLAGNEKADQQFRDATDRYWRNAGEVEARNVEGRQPLTPSQRRELTPAETMDVPISEQAVKRGFGLFGSPDQLSEKLIQPQPEGIRAYHGSPHDFDRFDLSKIGTGEGAQAFGHGLYFAQNEGVARNYRDQLSRDMWSAGDAVIPGKNSWLFNGSPEQHAVDALKRFGGDRKSAAEFLQRYGNPAEQDAAKLIESGSFSGPIKESPGRMYEVNINAKPEQFLDWDKPLAGAAREAVASIDRRAAIHDPRYAPTNGDNAYHILADNLGGRDKATAALREAGIPGIKYLDQGSRGAGDGTSNYVVFNDKIIDILRKYGLAGLSMLPPAVASHIQSQLTPVDHDPFAAH